MLALSNLLWVRGLFEILKMFYPPKGLCKAEPNGVHLIFFHFIVSREGCWHFQIYRGWEAFLKSWKCFIPRRDAAKAAPKGSIWYSFHFIVSREGCWHFQIYKGWEAFLKSWKCFIPRREAAKAAPKGSNWESFHLIGVGNGSGGFKNTNVNSPFWNLENVLSPGGSCESTFQ